MLKSLMKLGVLRPAVLRVPCRRHSEMLKVTLSKPVVGRLFQQIGRQQITESK